MENDRILQKLEDHAIKLGAMSSDFGGMRAELVAVALTVTGLVRALREGDGDSLLTRVAILRDKVKELEDFRKEMRTRIWTLGIAVLASAVAIFGLGLKTWLRS